MTDILRPLSDQRTPTNRDKDVPNVFLCLTRRAAPAARPLIPPLAPPANLAPPEVQERALPVAPPPPDEAPLVEAEAPTDESNLHSQLVLSQTEFSDNSDFSLSLNNPLRTSSPINVSGQGQSAGSQNQNHSFDLFASDNMGFYPSCSNFSTTSHNPVDNDFRTTTRVQTTSRNDEPSTTDSSDESFEGFTERELDILAEKLIPKYQTPDFFTTHTDTQPSSFAVADYFVPHSFSVASSLSSQVQNSQEPPPTFSTNLGNLLRSRRQQRSSIPRGRTFFHGSIPGSSAEPPYYLRSMTMPPHHSVGGINSNTATTTMSTMTSRSFASRIPRPKFN